LYSILKILLLFLFSIHSYAEAPQILHTSKLEPNYLVLTNALDSISTSLDTLALSASELADSTRTDDKYSALHSLILKTSEDVHKAIARSTISSKHSGNTNDEFPVLKRRVDSLYDNQSYFSYADFAAIAITSVSVLITIGGIFIAALSFWGYKNIKNTTEETTRRIAEKVATDTTKLYIDNVAKNKLEELIDEGRFTKQLEEILDVIILRKDKKNENAFDKDIDWDVLSESIDSVTEKEKNK